MLEQQLLLVKEVLVVAGDAEDIQRFFRELVQHSFVLCLGKTFQHAQLAPRAKMVVIQYVGDAVDGCKGLFAARISVFAAADGQRQRVAHQFAAHEVVVVVQRGVAVKGRVNALFVHKRYQLFNLFKEKILQNAAYGGHLICLLYDVKLRCLAHAKRVAHLPLTVKAVVC